MERRAIANEWVQLDALKKSAVARTHQVLNTKGAKARDVNMATRNVISMNAQEMERQKREDEAVRRAAGMPDQTVALQHGGGMAVANVPMEALLREPSYLEYLRNQAVLEDSDRDAGAVGAIGEPGTMENGPAPALPGPGAD